MDPRDIAKHIGVVDSWLGKAQAWGAVASPATNTVIATSGALVEGWWDVDIWVAGSGAMTWDFCVWDWLDGGAGVIVRGYFCMAGLGVERLSLKDVYVVSNGSFRVIALANTNININAVIIAVRRA